MGGSARRCTGPRPRPPSSTLPSARSGGAERACGALGLWFVVGGGGGVGGVGLLLLLAMVVVVVVVVILVIVVASEACRDGPSCTTAAVWVGALFCVVRVVGLGPHADRQNRTPQRAPHFWPLAAFPLACLVFPQQDVRNPTAALPRCLTRYFSSPRNSYHHPPPRNPLLSLFLSAGFLSRAVRRRRNAVK